MTYLFPIKAFLFFLMISISLSSYSQELVTSETISLVAEDLAEDENDPSLVSFYAELLSELYEHPVRINDSSDIQRLFFLNTFQQRILYDHLRNSGKIRSVYEVATIPGFDIATAKMLAPFITFDEANDRTKFLSRPLQSIILNSSLKSGPEDEGWPGSPFKALLKYRISAGKISAGFTAEKDPGEKLILLNSRLPDFTSGWLSYKGDRLFKNIIIGDFSLRTGQGSGINTGFSSSTSPSLPVNISGRNEIKPYTSADEYSLLRGVAINASAGRYNIIMYYSVNSLDAGTDTNMLDGRVTVSSLNRSGYHNSASAIAGKDILKESLTGGSITFETGSFVTGISGYTSHYSLPFATDRGDPEKLYRFTGNRNSVISIYYNLLLRNIFFTGEYSFNPGGGSALLQNISARLSDRMGVSLLCRDLSPGFINFHARIPGTSSAGNERSLQGSLFLEVAKGLFIYAGAEIKSYPWLRYNSSSPSLSSRQEVRIKYIVSDRLQFESLAGFRINPSFSETSTGIPGLTDSYSRSLRIQSRYSPLKNLTMITRGDIRSLSGSGRSSYLLLQDLIWRSEKLPLSVWYRYSVFSTADYQSGIRTWENDLLYSFSIPVLYGNGSRTYFMVSFEAGEMTEIRLKLASTSFTEEGISKGFREVRGQVRLRF